MSHQMTHYRETVTVQEAVAAVQAIPDAALDARLTLEEAH